MGRIIKDFVARRSGKHHWDSAVVDTGADITVLSSLAADTLKVPEEETIEHTVRGVGGTETKGHAFLADIEVGKARARCPVFVPTKSKVVTSKGNEEFQEVESRDNLIGSEFLQRVKARLDYSKPHGEVFSASAGTVGLMRSVPTSKKDRDMLRRDAHRIFGKYSKKRLTKQEQEKARREVEVLKKELRALMK